MVKRKRRTKPKQQNRKNTRKMFGSRQASVPRNNPQSNTAERSDTKSMQEPKGEWVMIEHRDADGNPTLPKDLIDGTAPRHFEEVPDGTEIKALVLAGYKPKPLLMVERKIYEIHRLTTQGWRRSGQILVEVDGWRQHERSWFDAMLGVRMEISDPGFTGPHNEKSKYIVSGTAFDRKIVHLHDKTGNEIERKLYEGTLDITETWKSAWQRNAADVLNLGFKYFLLPVICAVLGGLVVWWIDRQPIVETQYSVSEESKINHNVAEIKDDSQKMTPHKETNYTSANPVLPSKSTNERDSLGGASNNKSDANQSAVSE